MVHLNKEQNPLTTGTKIQKYRHNECDGVPNQRRHYCILNSVFWHRSKKTSTFRVTGFCEGNSPVNGEFSAQRASNAEIVSIWWRLHEIELHMLRDYEKIFIYFALISKCLRYPMHKIIIMITYFSNRFKMGVGTWRFNAVKPHKSR